MYIYTSFVNFSILQHVCQTARGIKRALPIHTHTHTPIHMHIVAAWRRSCLRASDCEANGRTMTMTIAYDVQPNGIGIEIRMRN